MPQPTLTKAETEASLIKKLQEENLTLRSRLQTMSTTAGSTHQSRLSTFHDSFEQQRRQSRTCSNPQTLNDIVPIDIPPPVHIVDDFFIIAQETLNVGHMADSNARGLRSLIKNISSGGSPTMGRKESLDRGKKRSGSVGSRFHQ